LVAIVEDATKSGQKVRAIGKGWSFSDAVLASLDPADPNQPQPAVQDVLVDTWPLNYTLGATPVIKFDAQKFNAVYRPAGVVPEAIIVSDPGLGAPPLYHVEAGITLRELYLRLDGRLDENDMNPPQDDASGPGTK
jgi:hypothetical protein